LPMLFEIPFEIHNNPSSPKKSQEAALKPQKNPGVCIEYAQTSVSKLKMSQHQEQTLKLQTRLQGCTDPLQMLCASVAEHHSSQRQG